VKIQWLLLALSLSACSVYESSGRKYLESNAYSCCSPGLQADSAAAQKYLVGCDRSDLSETWQLSDKNQLAEVYRSNDTLDLRVRPLNDPGLSCTFRFANESDLSALTNSAIDLTILQVTASPHTP
jgi:hypothetical protein